MRSFHFSLRSMFGLVSFLAIGCGLLIYTSRFTSSLTFTGALAVLVCAIPCAVGHEGERRAFWTGFAAFGSVYLWFICGSWQSPDGNEPLRERLPTTAILRWCHEKVARSQPAPIVVSAGGMGPGMSSMMSGAMAGGSMMPGTMSWMPPVTTVVTPDWSDFSTTGQSLFAILFAVFGGLIGRRSHRWARTASLAR
ncbi:MAG TPA: hypothetical protein VHC22_08610 [Pirellulales bacterium]|nr:hypothetical protein [Pirellulales bacterium]